MTVWCFVDISRLYNICECICILFKVLVFTEWLEFITRRGSDNGISDMWGHLLIIDINENDN